MINLKKQDPIADAVKEILQQEALKGNQHKIDKNKNNKIDAEDFKILRKEETVDEALKGNQHKIDKNKNNKIDAEDFKILRKEETVEEGIKDIAKKAFKALTGGSDEDQLKALQKRAGAPVTGKKPEPKKEEVETQKTLRWFKENAFDWKKKPEPTPNGGSGVKQGSRYGGSKQKDVPEKDTDEKK